MSPFLSTKYATGAINSLNEKATLPIELHGVQVVGGSNPLAPTNISGLARNRQAAFVSSAVYIKSLKTCVFPLLQSLPLSSFG